MVVTKSGDVQMDGILTYQDFVVTFGGETRTVKGWLLAEYDGKRVWKLRNEFTAKVGNGKKAHRVGTCVLESTTGNTLKADETVNVLNRRGWLTGFWQACYDAPEGYGSKHNGTYHKPTA